MPVPVPAVCELLKGMNTEIGKIETELTTPTGAALLKILVKEFHSEVKGNILNVAYGAGTKDFDNHANVLQVILMEEKGNSISESVVIIEANIDEYHEYSVEWVGADLVFRLDGNEVYSIAEYGDQFPEPLFAILNYAKVTADPMQGEWVMEVDWVKHEYWKD